jgi:hypothetical protein
MTEREGSCFCGAVRYRVRGTPKFVAHDHCSICRRIAGAAYVTWAGFAEAEFEIVGGEPTLTTFASTPEGKRQFCSRCGSHLFFRGTRWPGEVHVTLATLKDTEGLTPTQHVFVSDKASWHTIGDDLPRCGGKTGEEPMP